MAGREKEGAAHRDRKWGEKRRRRPGSQSPLLRCSKGLSTQEGRSVRDMQPFHLPLLGWYAMLIGYLFQTVAFSGVAQARLFVDGDLLIPSGFLENCGQVRDEAGMPVSQVRFSFIQKGWVGHLTPEGVIYQVYKACSLLEGESPISLLTEVYPVRLRFAEAAMAYLLPEERLSGEVFFYRGGGGVGPVYQYRRVRYAGLWPGTTVTVEIASGGVEWAFYVEAGYPDPPIRFSVEGAEVRIEEGGALAFHTPAGVLYYAPPKAWAGGTPIPVHWTVEGSTVTLRVYERPVDKPLYIDPLVRAWGTYFGGNENDVGRSVATDAAGYVYLAGWTTSLMYVATSGAHQTIYGGGDADAFLAKFAPDGHLLWATYFGGDSLDGAYACSVARNGDVLIAGVTSSPSGIATGGTLNTAYGGGGGDGFVARFDSSGLLRWAGYVGGTGEDALYAVVESETGDIFVVGSTSSQGIATLGTAQAVYGGGDSDVLVASLTGGGNLRWLTYLGGSSADMGYFCQVREGSIYVVGATASTDFPVNSSAYQAWYGGGLWDGFVARLDTGGGFIWSTYYGGEDRDWLYGAWLKPGGPLYVVGSTGSHQGIATTGSYRSQYIGGSCDGWLASFDSSGALLWGTYFGSDTNDWGYRCVGDASGHIYVAGWTRGSNGIATSGAPQITHAGGVYDAFLMIFSPLGFPLWGTYYGGSGWDWGRECALGPDGAIYLTGYTASYDNIATNGAYQEWLAGGMDAFLVKYESGTTFAFTDVSNASPHWHIFPNPVHGQLQVETTEPISLEIVSMDGKRWSWMIPSGGRHVWQAEMSPGLYVIRDATNRAEKVIVLSGNATR